MLRFAPISLLCLTCWIAVCAIPAAAQDVPHGQKDYCSLAIPDYSAGALPPKDAAADVIDDLLARGVQLTRQPDFRSIGVANDPVLAQRIAVALICGGKDRYIFFDTGAVAEMNKSGSEWAKYFVFAHEIAHHMHLDPLTVNRDPQVELNADEDAAKWLTRMGASMEQIAKAIDAMKPSDQRENGYPAGCERIFAAIRGYNAAARDYNRHGDTMKVYQEGNCVLTEVPTPRVVTAVPPPTESAPTVGTIGPTPEPPVAATSSPATQNAADKAAAPVAPATIPAIAAGLNAYRSLFPGLPGLVPAPRANSPSQVNFFPGYQRPHGGEFVKIIATGVPDAVDAITLSGYFSEYFHAPPHTDATFRASRVLRLEVTEDNGVNLPPSGCNGIVITLNYHFEDLQGAALVAEGSGAQNGTSCGRRIPGAPRAAMVDAIRNLEFALAGAGGPR